ncbi:T9SS type A sorting domain-containing protein [uncultured Algibacter sp.]|uniref:T9SS type A sorting domain-containing protein n=1 Tax=uncultured Algibacter sp. TaxID=298659 RepID=UPI0025FFE8D6|nr:T9SS type A sorting domain-containing protein [uncultured Algibacter sp.]
MSLYPNPAQSILNLKFESNRFSNLKVEIISLDGKKVKSSSLSNYENTQIDISNLSQGVYLTNFYSGRVLIASKKFVKN